MTAEETPIVCTLEPDQLGSRGADWGSLMTRVEARESIPGGARLSFPHDADIAAAIAGLAAKEVVCCAFFTFELHIDVEKLWLDITAPPNGQPVIDLIVSGAPLTESTEFPVEFVKR